MTDDRWVPDQRHEQETADRALRELFAGQPRPDLPPFFEHRCASRARYSPAARPLGATARLVMRAYWALTLVIGAVVLVRTEWPTAMSPVVAAGALVSVAAVLVPVLFFADLRGGLFALMRRVMG